jgi:hypothetical protein
MTWIFHLLAAVAPGGAGTPGTTEVVSGGLGTDVEMIWAAAGRPIESATAVTTLSVRAFIASLLP